MSNPVAMIESRIAQIQARFAAFPTGSISGANFQQTLASVETQPLFGSPTSADGQGVTGADVIAAGEKYLGVPYKWGGTDPAEGFDCSGFVQRTFADLGIQLPRLADAQAEMGTPVTSLADARPGDLVAFGSPVDHIGIYAGNGQMLVAPHTGDVVKLQPITREPTAIRRIITQAPPAASGAPLSRPAWLSQPSSGAARFADAFRQAEQRHGLPSGVLSAIAQVESSFNPSAVSEAGAEGLMQLMPDTARGLGVDPFDPTQAIDGAARLLSGHLERFGSIQLALAAYNAGGAAVAKAGGIPPYAETQDYVRKVLAIMNGGAA